MYAVTWQGNILRTDLRTGITEPIGLYPAGRLNSLTADDHGRLYTVHVADGRAKYPDTSRLLQLDPRSGDIVRSTDLERPLDVRALSFDSSGRLLAIASEAGAGRQSEAVLYSISTKTGACTRIGSTGLSTVQSLCLGGDGRVYAYAAAHQDKSQSWGPMQIDCTTGVASRLTPTPAPTELLQSIAFAPGGVMIGVWQRGDSENRSAGLVEIALPTGKLKRLAPFAPWDVRGMEFIPAAAAPDARITTNSEES